MKLVQIGILVVLIAVGALLFMVWRGQTPPRPDALTSPGVQTSESAPPTPAEAAPKPQATSRFRREAAREARASRAASRQGLEPAGEAYFTTNVPFDVIFFVPR